MGETVIPVVGFVAPSGSGKTSLIRQVVAVLGGRGLRVGYLKHAHHRFDLDVPGKDSYEVREAGAQQTLLAPRHAGRCRSGIRYRARIRISTGCSRASSSSSSI